MNEETAKKYDEILQNVKYASLGMIPSKYMEDIKILKGMGYITYYEEQLPMGVLLTDKGKDYIEKGGFVEEFKNKPKKEANESKNYNIARWTLILTGVAIVVAILLSIFKGSN